MFSVSQFNNLIKEIVREVGVFTVKGEVTEFTITQKKGVYLTLSDGKSNLKVSGYAPLIKGIDQIEKGMSVVVEGVCDIYAPYGTFSLAISSITPEGEGSLGIAYEKLKEKLLKEGLFDNEYKKPLPEFITKIALLTGKDSAAYSDFVKILHENQSGIEIDYYPVIVQGENAIGSIMEAINICKNKEYDAIVLSRGGGSLEDLKSFNDEGIAREIFTSQVPFIVGVGHEKDESICDFVADVRASTPSQCAYYLISQNQAFIEGLNSKIDIMFQVLNEKRFELTSKVEDLSLAIGDLLERQVENMQVKVNHISRLIKSYDVVSVLDRGFAVLESHGKSVSSIRNLAIGDDLAIILKDGKINSEVKEIIKNK